MTERPERPTSVPADAEWNSSENEWELGPKNADGEPIGEWRWWAPEGYLVCKAGYDDAGQLHGLLERWHPNGERAQWATWVHGKTHGMQVWTLATEGPSDKNSHLPPNVTDDVKRMDMPYYHGEAQPYHFTLYYASGLEDEVPVDADGRSIDLGEHLERVAPDSTLLLLEPTFETVDGEEVSEPEASGVRWIYRGQSDGHFEVRLTVGREHEDYLVSADEISRAFTLSATHYIAWRDAQKPSNLPDDAIWSHRQENWFHGESDDGKSIGRWRWWDADGTLRKEAHYNEHGALHGTFRQFHPDGTTATEGEYDNGNRIGTWTSWRSTEPTDMPLSAAENVWRVEYHQATDARRHFTQDGTETNSRGVPLDEAYDDEFWRERSPETFLDDGFEAFLEKWFEESEDDSLASYADVFEETMGFAPPPQLAALSRALDRFGRVMLFEWRSDLYPDIAPDLDEVETDNLFERLVLFAQGGYLDTSLHEAFSGVALVGTLGNGDSYMVSVLDQQLYDEVDDGQLFFFSHDNMALDAPFSPQLSHLVYASSLAYAWRDLEAVSDEMFQQAWSRLSGAIDPSWHWSGIMNAGTDDDFQPFETEHQTSRYHFWCSYWIIQLLRGFDGIDAVEIDPKFWLSYDNPPDELAQKAAGKPAIGLNLMWRAFFFDDEEFLVQMLDACRSSASRLMRDAGALIERFRAGDRQLGGIDDIYELRDAFIELDLHPDRAAEREAEAAEAERKAAQRAAEAKERVANLAANGEDLEEVFWTSWDEPELLDAFFDHWRDDPEFTPLWEAMGDFSQNAGGFGTYEIIDGRQWVAEHPDGRITGIIAAGVRDRSLVAYRELLPVLDWSRGFEPILGLLDTYEEFHHVQKSVVETVGKHGVEEAVPGIIRSLEEAAANDRFNTSADFQAACLLALAQIGSDAARDYLHESTEQRRYPVVALAPAHAELGSGDFISDFLASLEDDAPAEVLWALAEMAPAATDETRAEAQQLLGSFEDKPVVEMLLAKHAAVRFGADFGDLRRWVRTALAPESKPYSADKGAAQCVWALKVAAWHDEIEPDVILAWVDHDVPEVAEAAQAAADRRGIAYDVRHIDRWDADAIYEKSGAEGLRDALADPSLAHMHAVVAKLAEVGDPDAPAAIAARIASFIEGWKEISSGGDTPRLLSGMFRALRHFDDDEALVTAALACFEHGHSKIIDPALREPLPLDERLREHMEAAVAKMSGWKERSAREWLEREPN